LKAFFLRPQVESAPIGRNDILRGIFMELSDLQNLEAGKRMMVAGVGPLRGFFVRSFGQGSNNSILSGS
jgi:hypothetical protein